MTARQTLIANRKNAATNLLIWPYIESLAASNPTTLASRIRDGFAPNQVARSYSVNPDALKTLARNFHERVGTLSDKVLRNIGSLHDDVPRLRVSHQINTLPSLGICAQFMSLDRIGSVLRSVYNLSCSSIYVVIDYDIANDSRFRTAHFPDIFSRSGTIPLGGVVHKSDFLRPMFAPAKPSKQVIDQWLARLGTSIKANNSPPTRGQVASTPYNNAIGNLAIVEAILLRAYDVSVSLSDFNAAFLSIICNEYWGYDVAFIPGAQLQPHLAVGYRHLLERDDEIKHYWNEGISLFKECGVDIKANQLSRDDALFWIICLHCHARMIVKHDGHPTRYKSHCEQCGADELHSLESVISDLLPQSGRVAPRIVLDDLLDSISLGMSGGSSYIGAAEHRFISNYVSKQLGIFVPPELLWSPNAFSRGPVESFSWQMYTSGAYTPRLPQLQQALSWITTGRSTLLYFAIYCGLVGVARALEEFLVSYNVDDIVRLSHGMDQADTVRLYNTLTAARTENLPR